MGERISSLSRVRAALNHREADRVPLDMGANANSGIHIQAYRRLKERLGLSGEKSRVSDIITQRALIEEDLKRQLGIDVDGFYPDPPASWSLQEEENDGYRIFQDEFGISWQMPLDRGLYYDICQHPLKEADTIREIEDFPLLDPEDPARCRRLKDFLKKAEREERAVLINSITGGIFELSLWMRGFARFFLDLAASPGMAEALLDKLLEFRMKYWAKVLEIVGERPVIIGEADDIASQNSTLISPEMYRRFIKPRHRRLFDFIRKKARGPLYIFYHSCGAVGPLIPDLIEEGINILNPVQISASGMDLRELKKDFGDCLTFWGGGVDTQKTLPYGSPEEVREEVRRNIEILAPGGGFVFTTVHNIQADVPVENILALWETLEEYGKY